MNVDEDIELRDEQNKVLLVQSASDAHIEATCFTVTQLERGVAEVHNMMIQSKLYDNLEFAAFDKMQDEGIQLTPPTGVLVVPRASAYPTMCYNVSQDFLCNRDLPKYSIVQELQSMQIV